MPWPARTQLVLQAETDRGAFVPGTIGGGQLRRKQRRALVRREYVTRDLVVGRRLARGRAPAAYGRGKVMERHAQLLN